MNGGIETSRYGFRPVTQSDLPVLKEWLAVPDIVKWFGDPHTVEELEQRLDDRRIRMRFVTLDAVPFAYVQDYDIHGWPDHHLSFLPKGARGLDTFIGKPDLLGRGHGPAYLGVLAEALFAGGVPALGIDPHPDNSRACRAYEKVGFSGDRELVGEWGRVRLLTLFPPVTSPAVKT